MAGGVGVEFHAAAVDGDVVVVPAKGDEVVRVVAPALASGPDVVYLEPVSALAAVDSAAPLVTLEDVEPGGPGYGFSQVAVTDRVFPNDVDPDLAVTEDLV